MSKRIFLSIVMLVITFTVSIAQMQITGTVIDKENNESMPFANVAIYNNNQLITGTSTSINGKFQVKAQKGSYSIEISVIGYDKKRIENIKVTDKPINLGKIFLSASTENLEEVLVTANRSSIETKAGKQVLNVGNDIANGGGNITNVLKTIPSVEITPRGDISIRGNENVKVLINGKEVAYGISSEMLLKQIPANMVNQVEVITNASAELDPEFTGGVINVVTKKSITEGINGGISIEAGMEPLRASAGLNIGYGTKKLSTYLNYGYYQENYTFDYNANSIFETGLFDRNHQYGNGDIKVSGHMFMFGADYDFNEKSSLNAELMYNIYDENWKLNTNNDYFDEFSSLLINTNNANKDKVNLGNLSLKYKNQITDKQKLELNTQFSYGGLKSDRTLNNTINDAGSENTNIKGDGKFIINETKLDYFITFSEKISLESGLQANILTFDSKQNTISNNSSSQNYDYKQQKYAFYLNYLHQLGDFSLKLGLRPDKFNSTTKEGGETNLTQDEFQVFPSVALQYDIAKGKVFSTVALTYSKRIIRPDYEQLDPYEDLSDPYHIYKGNPALKPEYYHSLELLYARKKGKSSINTVFFGKLTNNVIQEQTTVLQDQRLLTTYINHSKSYSLGAELNATFYPVKGLDIRPSALYVYHWFAEPKESVPADYYHKNGYDLNLKLDINYKINTQHSVQLTGMYYGENRNLFDTRKPYYTLNAGYNYSLLGGMLDFGISVNDIFNSGGKEFYHTIGNGFKTDSEWKFNNRFIKASINLFF